MNAQHLATPQRVEVCIVLPVFNRLHLLRKTVDSVLRQTFANWRLIIVDDGSDEQTRAWLAECRDARIDLLSRSHCGNPGAVRNAGIGRANGRYLAFIDSDDVWTPTRLERQLHLMQQTPTRRWSYCMTRMIDADDRLLPAERFHSFAALDGRIVEPLLRREASVATPSVLLEKSLLDETGGFDERLRFGEDYDLWLRLALRSEVSVHVEPLVYIRTHAENYTRNRLETLGAWASFYRTAQRHMPTRRLRALCREMRGIATLDLARAHFARGNWTAAMTSLLRALPPGLTRRNWWRHLWMRLWKR